MGKFIILVNILRKNEGNNFYIRKTYYIHEDIQYNRAVCSRADIVEYKDTIENIRSEFQA